MITTGSRSLNKVLNNGRRAINISPSSAGFLATEANWEVYYNGYWRDVQDNWEWDYTKEGFKILRAQHFDDGEYRSYRDDRGLILREKEKEEKTQEGIFAIDPSVFLQSAMRATAVGLGMQSFDRIIEPKIFKSKMFYNLKNKSPAIAMALMKISSKKWNIISAASNIGGVLFGGQIGAAAASAAEVGLGAIVARLARRAPVVGPVFTGLRLAYMVYQGASIPNAILSELGIGVGGKVSEGAFDFFSTKPEIVSGFKPETTPLQTRNQALTEASRRYLNMSVSAEWMPNAGIRLRRRYAQGQLSETSRSINENLSRYFNIRIQG